MASALSDLTGAATRSSEDFDWLQQEVGRNKVATEKLLKEGRASGQVAPALLFKASLNASAGLPGLLHWDLQPASPPGSLCFPTSRRRSCWTEQKLPEA